MLCFESAIDAESFAANKSAIQTIARDLHLSRSTVKRALHDLQQAGRIIKTARKRGNGSRTSNGYYIP